MTDEDKKAYESQNLKPPGPRRRKQPSERLRRLIHVLLNDEDYIRLLRAAPDSVSAYCRNAIIRALDEDEASEDPDDPDDESDISDTPDDSYQGATQ